MPSGEAELAKSDAQTHLDGDTPDENLKSRWTASAAGNAIQAEVARASLSPATRRSRLFSKR